MNIIAGCPAHIINNTVRHLVAVLAIGTFFPTGYWPLYSSCMFCQICKLQGPLIQFCCRHLEVFSRGCFGSIKIWKLLHNRIKHVNFRNDYLQIFGKLHAYRYFCFWIGVYCPRQRVIYLLLAAWVVSSSDREFPQVGTLFHKCNWAISWQTYLIKLRTRGSPLLGHFLWLLPSPGLGKIVQNYNSVVAREDGTWDPWWVSRTCLVIRCKVNPYIITIKIPASGHRPSE